MHKTTLPFATGKIKLVVPELPKNISWEEIEVTIDALVRELETNLNFRWPDSEIYQFNNAEIGVRHRISEPTHHYLKTIQQAEAAGDSLKLTDTHSLNYELQQDTWEVIKLSTVKINSNLLFKAFIIDEIRRFINHDFAVSNFFLESNDFYITQGDKYWEVEVPLTPTQDSETAQMHLQNETMLWERWKNREGDNPFTGAYSQKEQPQIIIAEGQNAINTKIAVALAQNKSDRQLDLQEVAQQWRCGFTLIYNHGEIKQVSSQK